MQPFLIHAHFYQPERANPWTQALDPEPSAAPFRDWNERIHKESYRANAFARIFDDDGRVERIVNSYEHLSFNFGPTLLAWLERWHPATYARILEADRLSRMRLGHGNALAQAFHHTILPLDTERNRRTQIRWGMADFRHRFGREPEGMWLPETAADQAVVDTLIEEGLRFTVLAPRQAASVREAGGDWKPVDGVPDPSRPYRIYHSDGSGRALGVFFYDGELAQRFAFDPRTMVSETMLDALTSTGRSGLVHAAMDGETFGHHHRFGELGLAYTLTHVAPQRGLEPTNFGAYLDSYPPTAEAQLVEGEGSSWSCAHGVGRWARDCGCSTHAEEGWNQAWRGPLRAAVEVVREAANEAFEQRGGELLGQPWAARDDYVRVIIGATGARAFLAQHAVAGLSAEQETQVWSLLEAQRNSMAAYTSCGWFFADISGIETVYVMRFAARALELLEQVGCASPRARVQELLGQARSNVPGAGTGADVWRQRVEPDAVRPDRVAGEAALRAAAGLDPEGAAEGHDVDARGLTRQRVGACEVVTATVGVTARTTTRSEAYTIAGVRLPDLGLRAWVAPVEVVSAQDLASAVREVPEEGLAASLARLVGGDGITLDSALPAGREEIVAAVGRLATGLLGTELSELHRRFAPVLHELRADDAPPTAAEKMLERARAVVLGDQLVEDPSRATDPGEARVAELVRARQAGYDLEITRLERALGGAITAGAARAARTAAPADVDQVLGVLATARALDLDVDLDEAQVHAYDLALRVRDGDLHGDEADGAVRLGTALGLAAVTWGGRSGGV